MRQYGLFTAIPCATPKSIPGAMLSALLGAVRGRYGQSLNQKNLSYDIIYPLQKL